MPDEIEIRKEKIKNFINEKLDKKIWLTLAVYIISLIIIYFYFGKTIKYGQFLLFIIIPIISIILIFLKKTEYALLLNIAAWGFIIRIQNLQFLKDATTGTYIPADPDAMAFLRYAQYILEHGSLMNIDTLRYYPIGFTGLIEFKFLSFFIVYLYKFIHFFNPSVTLELIDITYPAIVFPLIIIMFFLFIRKIIGGKQALLAALLLTIIPSFLFRTTTGVSDKEAFGVLAMFTALYFFTAALKSEKTRTAIILSIFSGIFMGVMGLVWGGSALITSTIAIFYVIKIILGKLSKKDIYIYTIWYIFTYGTLALFFGDKYSLSNVTSSLVTLGSTFVFITLIIHYLLFQTKIFKTREKIERKIHPGIFAILITIILGTLFQLIKVGPQFFKSIFNSIFIYLVKPFATNRWVITVAESHQPYIVDWISNFNKVYFWLFLISAIILFYDILKSLNKEEKKRPWLMSAIFGLFLFGFIFSRYSQSSVLNGESNFALFIYFTSIVGFILLTLSPVLFYHNRKEKFEHLKNVNEGYIFILILFLVLAIAARSAIRLIFIFTPATVIMFSFLVFRIAEKVKQIKTSYLRIGIYIIIILFTINITSDFARATISQASGIGPTYSQQWQVAGDWVRKNTPGDAVFAHWWDYGYLIQTGMRRATLSDGGNARNAINHFVGRHVLTGHNETEALELLKANNATNLLIISDEIGKYPAFSSIGADENYDRYSWINTFSLDQQNSRETRNGTTLVYTGGTPLDDDIIYQGKLYPRRSAGIGAFLVPVNQKTITNEKNESSTQLNFNQPKALLVYNGQQIEIRLSCIFFQGQEFRFNNYDIDACILLFPVIQNNQVNPIGAALYLSPEVYSTLFTKLYLFGKSSEHFKLVYDDSNNIPLAVYNGRLIGPIRIWQISYPNNLNIPEYYYTNEFPNPEVNEIKDEFS